MYLKKLHITNFRCFADYEIEFAPRVTVLFGKNGSGKTTLIHAIHKALSFLMYSEEIKEKVPKGKKAKVLEVKTFRLRNRYPKVEGFSGFDCEYKGTKRGDYEININAHALFGNTLPLEWDMTGVAPKFSLRKSGYRSKFLELYQWYKDTNPSPQLPLLAFYSDGFPHNTTLNQSKSTEKTKRDFHLQHNFPELGFTDWNSEKGFTNVWLERLKNTLNHLDYIPRENKVFKDRFEAGKMQKDDYDKYVKQSLEDLSNCNSEIDLITNCLHKFSEGDKTMEVVSLGLGITNRTEVCLITADRERHSFSELPAGYKRIFYMALDIAYRSFLLSNGESTDIPGIAIIDEIDLHLHPELEQVVLQRFMTTFTKVQFIISTHSPLVLTGLETEGKPNSILNLNPVSPKEPILWHDIYGLDSSTGLTEVMGVTPSNEELNWMISQCAFMYYKHLEPQAEIMKKDILSNFAINPDRLEDLIMTKVKAMENEIH